MSDHKPTNLAQVGQSALTDVVIQNESVSTFARESAGNEAAEALEALAMELEKDGKPYGAEQVRIMASEAMRWGLCV